MAIFLDKKRKTEANYLANKPSGGRTGPGLALKEAITQRLCYHKLLWFCVLGASWISVKTVVERVPSVIMILVTFLRIVIYF